MYSLEDSDVIAQALVFALQLVDCGELRAHGFVVATVFVDLRQLLLQLLQPQQQLAHDSAHQSMPQRM